MKLAITAISLAVAAAASEALETNTASLRALGGRDKKDGRKKQAAGENPLEAAAAAAAAGQHDERGAGSTKKMKKKQERRKKVAQAPPQPLETPDVSTTENDTVAATATATTTGATEAVATTTTAAEETTTTVALIDILPAADTPETESAPPTTEAPLDVDAFELSHMPLCPESYDHTKTSYVAGDLVEVASNIFMCHEGEAYEVFCNVAVWTDTLLQQNPEALELWSNAWVHVEACAPISSYEVMEEEIVFEEEGSE